MYAKFTSQHAYARRNGYKGTYDEYLELQYQTYRALCKRVDVKPKKKQEWMEIAN